MAELFLSSPEPYEARVSPAVALVLTLPLVDLAPRFPGVDGWLMQLPGRLGSRARTDVRLLSVPLSGVLSYFLEAPSDEESAEPALALLRETPAEAMRDRVLENLAAHLDLADGAALVHLLEHDQDRVRELIYAMDSPNPDEAFALDVDRAIDLLRDATALKAMTELRLGQLWHDHFEPRWRAALPTARRLAAAARNRFGLGDARRVLNSIVGDGAQQRLDKVDGHRLIFCPVPFLGPYVARAVGRRGGDGPIYIGFGVVRRDGAVGAEDGHSELADLFMALQSLADEARLNAVAYIRENGKACAADFMERFGWSQPATSRHLRALESTGLITADRVDGVKWYTIRSERAQQIVQSLQRFLSAGGDE